jgi:hypothetical protein
VYTNTHLLITVGGTAWTLTETWQFSIRANPTNTLMSDGDCQNLANTLSTPTQAFLSATNTGVSNQAFLTWIKVAKIDTTGHYPADHVPGIYNYVTPVAGGAASSGIPQATMAVTLLTAKPRGRASHGRFYLPPCAFPVQADGRLTAGQADGIETLAVTWIRAINAAAEVDACAVFSGLGSGTTALITKCGVGRVIDTMRSRRRALAEGRTMSVI